MAKKSFYKDISLNLKINPFTGDINLLRDEEAVKKALGNLIKTQTGTRPFRPDFGVDIEKYLFGPADYDTEVSINEEISRAIEIFEPRVRLISIESIIEDDSSVKVSIAYFVIGVAREQLLETTITTRIK
jgi:phage baseplate assembly protein W